MIHANGKMFYTLEEMSRRGAVFSLTMSALTYEWLDLQRSFLPGRKEMFRFGIAENVTGMPEE